MRTSHPLLVLIFAALPAAAAELQIRLYDLARMPTATLERSIQVAQRVLATTGIHATWSKGDREDPQAYEISYAGAAKCTSSVEFNELRIRVIANTPPGVPVTALGMAYPCSNTGVQVTIFADHVAAFTRESDALADVLAYAMMHEIGHVLLRSDTHSPAGVMKMSWTESDWRTALSGRLYFEPEQVARMLRSLSERAQREVPIGTLHQTKDFRAG